MPLSYGALQHEKQQQIENEQKQLPFVWFLLPNNYYKLQTIQLVSPIACLPIAFCLLPMAHCLLVIAFCFLSIVLPFKLLTAAFQLYKLPIANRMLAHSSFYFLIFTF
jgi:hypothetical protein